MQSLRTLHRTFSTGLPALQAAVVRRALARGLDKLPKVNNKAKEQVERAPGTYRTVRTGVLAIKKGMSCIWDEWGERLPVTLLQLDNAYVTQTKTAATDRHWAVQVGCSLAKAHRVGKSVVKHCEKAAVPPLQHLGEFKVTRDSLLPAGMQLNVGHFTIGQFVDVTGTSVGKGFQGVMKRWGFKGLPATHGVSVSHRSHGSTGQCQDPGRVFKGKKMAGRMGGKQRTVQNLQVVKIDHDNNVLYVKGAVPGHENGVLRVSDARKKYWDGQTKLGVAGPVPSHSGEAKRGEEWMAKSGSDPYLRYEEA
ncbi:hypothetical protein RI367_003760 [Sorochytrium milnesiophthora]